MTIPRLVIFTRFPEPGRTKTRLIPALGAAGAARLQDAMTRHTLGVAAEVGAGSDVEVKVEVEVRHTGGDADGHAMAHRYGRANLRYQPQGDGNLGERLAQATSACGPVVVIGTDCPALSGEIIRDAFRRLDRHDVVLGPAADGGYYLVGLRRPAAGLFAGIDWSTDRVLAQTLAAAERLALTVAPLLPTLSDVDVPADLVECRKWLVDDRPPPYAPARVAVTGATGCLGRTLVGRLLSTLPDVRVTALVRAASPSVRAPAFRRFLDAYAGRITLVNGDLSSGPALCDRMSPADRRALAEADGGIWHFAASTNLHPLTPEDEARVRSVNADGTAAVLRLLDGSDRPGPIYHLSTAYVCGLRGGLIHEHELIPTGVRNAYEASKWAAEQRVREALDGGGLAGAILRPSLVIGEAPAVPATANVRAPAGIADVLAAAFAHAAARGRPVRLRSSLDVGVNAVSLPWVTRALLALAPLAAARRAYHLTSPADATIAAAAEAARASFGPFELRGDADVNELAAADRLADRLLRPYRPYFAPSRPRFDRRNFELDASDVADEPAIDLHAVFAARRDAAAAAAAAAK